MKSTPFRTAHIPLAQSRRDFLCQAGGGFGALALSWLLSRDGYASPGLDPSPSANPLAAKPPHFEAKAKSVIFMFMVGGPSHIDLFDPKPELHNKHGQAGLEVSDLLPHLATCVDDIAFLRSCWCTSTIHAPAMYELHSGRTLMGYPSLGSWVTYGLGSVSENLPAYCVMIQPEGTPEGGAPCWGAGFLPPVYQGTLLRKGSSPILNLKRPDDIGAEQQRRTLDLIKRMNEVDLDPLDTELAARIATYELAFRMQQHAPEAVDLSKETALTQRAYGLDDKRTADFGTRCLLARRLVERGVRFVQLYSGGGPLITQWDAHDDINGNHENMCGRVDKPIAALLADLKQRGLLDSTLVVWASEFGRTPMSQGGKGRDHNPYGYTMWMAGGGVKGGQAFGATDEFGLNAVTDRVSVHDFHATTLHLLGLDHEKLTYPHNSRDERLTDVSGQVIRQIVA